jgi:membrane-associated phospholipid phosphatase
MIVITLATLKQYQIPSPEHLSILALLLMDLFIINPAFKIIMGGIGINYQRPMYINEKPIPTSNLFSKFDRLGMPSGHMEICTIYLSYLYHYAHSEQLLGISLIWLVFGLTLITGYQRVYSKKHTVSQVIMGFLTGWLLGKYLPQMIADKIENK